MLDDLLGQLESQDGPLHIFAAPRSDNHVCRSQSDGLLTQAISKLGSRLVKDQNNRIFLFSKDADHHYPQVTFGEYGPSDKETPFQDRLLQYLMPRPWHLLGTESSQYRWCFLRSIQQVFHQHHHQTCYHRHLR